MRNQSRLKLPGKINAIFLSLLTLILGCKNGGNTPRSSNTGSNNPVVEMQVEADQIVKPVQIKNGFLNGFPLSAIPTTLVQDVKPKFWRVSDPIQAKNIKTQFGSTIALNIVDYYAGQKHFSWSAVNWSTWSWTDYQNFISTLVTDHASVVDYWDIWPEPDWSFTGGSDRMLKVYKIAHDTIRSKLPHAKIIGPDLSKYDSALIKSFIETIIIANNLRFDALSWHENGVNDERPEHFAAHYGEIKALIAQYPALCSPTCPEIHINEFTQPENAIIPGWTLGWLNAFESAGVDFVSRACWTTIEDDKKYNDCWQGMNGLLTQNSSAPKPLYWVHQAYAQMDGANRINLSYGSDPTSAQLTATASRADGARELRVLLGRYSCGAGGAWCSKIGYPASDSKMGVIDIRLTVNHYPYSSTNARVDVYRIPNDNVSGTLFGPLPVLYDTFPVSNGTLKVLIPNVQDGDVFNIIVH